MTRETLYPENKSAWLEMRAQDITSTEASVLFGLCPYLTLFELWHNKKNKIITEIEETDRMAWGNRLESVIGEHIIHENSWTGRAMKNYIRVPSLRAGSSFDFFVTVDLLPAILEIKNVDSFIFSKNWTSKDGIIEAPPHIEIQIQHQLMVSGHDTAYIGVLIGGNRLEVIKREKNIPIQYQLIKEIKKFWDSIDNNQAPLPDFEKDAAFIASLNNYAEPGKTIEAYGEITELAVSYKSCADQIKELEKKKDGYKAQLLIAIGDAEKCKGENFTISAGVTGETKVGYIRKSFRNFKVTFRQEKE